MALRPSTVDVLLALLEHADASALLILMEPENVLTLLRHDGWSDDAVRKALKEEKKLPGELLLGLYERGRTTAELLEILGPAAVAKVEAERAKPAASDSAKATDAPAPAPAGAKPSPAKSAKTASATAPLGRVGVGNGRLQIAGLVLVLAAALVPSMLAVLDVKIALALLRLGIGPLLGLVGLTGALGGALAASPDGRRWALALSGAVASIGGCAAVIGYALWTARMGRASLLRLEIAVVCLIGMLPAVALARLLRKRV